jgi:hypothetical protein
MTLDSSDPGPTEAPQATAVDAPGPGEAGSSDEPEGRTRTAGLFVVVLVVAILGAAAGSAIVGAVLSWRDAASAVDPELAAIADQVYAGLPPGTRQELAAELERLMGDRLEGKTPRQIATEVAEATRLGLARLDDATLVRRLELQATALERASTAGCAAFMRMAFGGTSALDLSVAAQVVLQLSEAELNEWYALSLDGLRAELDGTPPRRSVSDDQFLTAFAPISERWTAADVALINAVTNDPASATDADACRMATLVYGDLELLSPGARAIVALYDINPPGS